MLGLTYSPPGYVPGLPAEQALFLLFPPLVNASPA